MASGEQNLKTYNWYKQEFKMYRSVNTICRNPNTKIYKTEVLVGNYNLDDFNKQTKLF